MSTRTLLLVIPGSILLAGSLATSVPQQAPDVPDEPRLVDGELVYPEGAMIPKYLTETESRWMRANPPVRGLPTTDPPVGPVQCASEYEPMDGILFAWEGFTGTIAQMAAAITTTGDANVYVACDSNNEANSARNSMISAGADPNRIVTIVRPTDTVWIRDYGPRMIRVGGCRAVVDHNYNRPRPNDDDFNVSFADVLDFDYYRLPLSHGGGNWHANGVGVAAATQLINNENPGYSEAQIRQIWRDYQNVETELHAPFPTSVDSTQHIDMWMQITGDRSVVIADYPLAPGSTHDSVADAQAQAMQDAGYTVTRVENIGNPNATHYTFTNVVMCNSIVLVPEYDNIPASYSANALAAWRAHLPDHQIIPIDCDAIVTASGVMHCIVMHVPAPDRWKLPPPCTSGIWYSASPRMPDQKSGTRLSLGRGRL